MSTTGTPQKGSSPPGKDEGKQVGQKTAEPVYYIQRVSFTQRTGPIHQGIVLVDSESSDQGRGTLVHVIGDVGLGMEHNIRKGYDFLGSRSYKSHVQVGAIPKSKQSEFLAIAQSIPPPHDPEVLFSRKPPSEDCTTWLDKLLQQTQHLATGS